MADYHITVRKFWFRKKPVFAQPLSEYALALRDTSSVVMRFNAGSMIYLLMSRLTRADWAKQDALVYSYRNLVYKLSYVDVTWQRDDMNVFHMEGRRNDVMWALSFITQVFPDEILKCETVPLNQYTNVVQFNVLNGQYAGSVPAMGPDMPDIWSSDGLSQQNLYSSMDGGMKFDPNFLPKSGQMFALPDGRVGQYIRMDDRFKQAQEFGAGIDVVVRHNISASIMKDFKDIVSRQASMKYDVYNMRYTAFMNKVHMLEHQFKGFDVSVYDVLPIAERGLPQAPMDTINRTNLMQKDSLKYIIDKVERNKGHLHENEKIRTMKDAAYSTIARTRGYNIEYQMYVLGNTPEDLCKKIHIDQMVSLYDDFAKLDSLGELKFPKDVYRILCNGPKNGIYDMTQNERTLLQEFGEGYADFLKEALNNPKVHVSRKNVYRKAYARLKAKYLDKRT